jgi:hypothetical protein
VSSKEDLAGMVGLAFMGTVEGNSDDDLRSHIQKCLSHTSGVIDHVISLLIKMNRLSENEEEILGLLIEFGNNDYVWGGDFLSFDGAKVEEKMEHVMSEDAKGAREYEFRGESVQNVRPYWVRTAEDDLLKISSIKRIFYREVTNVTYRCYAFTEGAEGTIFIRQFNDEWTAREFVDRLGGVMGTVFEEEK